METLIPEVLDEVKPTDPLPLKDYPRRQSEEIETQVPHPRVVLLTISLIQFN
jgi:hypothetical protein